MVDSVLDEKMNKVRRFMPGEFLNTVFSARHFGLALASDIKEALNDLPETEDVVFPCIGPGDDFEYTDPEPYYDAREIESWIEKWFSDFHRLELGENNE